MAIFFACKTFNTSISRAFDACRTRKIVLDAYRSCKEFQTKRVVNHGYKMRFLVVYIIGAKRVREMELIELERWSLQSQRGGV